MDKFIINFKEEKEVWNAFVAASPQRSVFSYSEFLDSLNTKYDLVTCYAKDKIVAGVVILYSDIGEPIVEAFPYVQYLSLLLADNFQKAVHSQVTYEFKVVEFFIDELIEKFKQLYLCHSWRLRDLRPLQWHNYNEPNKNKFNINLRYTGVLDLQKYNTFDEYLSQVRTVRRQEFKKSSQKLTLRFSDETSILETLLAKTFERQNLDITSKNSALVRSICKHAIDGEYGTLGIAMLGDIPISAVLFLYDDRSSYYLFSGNDPMYRSLNAGNFLILEMIKKSFDRGIEEIDFVGVNSPQRGDFKISFNAEIKPYFITNYFSKNP